MGSISKIRHIQESNRILENRLLNEQTSDFNSAMQNLGNDLQKNMGDQNIINKVGKENYDAIAKIASDNGMTLSNDSNSTYFKWTKDLGGGNILVLIILNSGNKPQFGGVTSYVDRDNGEYLKAESGKLVKTGKGKNGTYPSEMDQMGLIINNKNISDSGQPEFLNRLRANIKNQQNMFTSTKKPTANEPQVTNTGNKVIDILQRGKASYKYYNLDKTTNKLISNDGGLNTNVVINKWEFKDADTSQNVYVESLTGSTVIFTNTAGSATVEIKQEDTGYRKVVYK